MGHFWIHPLRIWSIFIFTHGQLQQMQGKNVNAAGIVGRDIEPGSRRQDLRQAEGFRSARPRHGFRGGVREDGRGPEQQFDPERAVTRRSVRFDWTDRDLRRPRTVAGTSRVVRTDDELAVASPIVGDASA
jgi:hypothetical protein